MTSMHPTAKHPTPRRSATRLATTSLTHLCAIAFLLSSVTTAVAQDGATARTATNQSTASDDAKWPQWRGPNLDGISTETDWSSEGKEKNLWFTNVGIGYSTVSIADGRLYTVGHDKEAGEDTIYCLDAKTGVDIWSHTFKSRTMAMAHKGGSLTTPSIDGPRVFASNREGSLMCFDGKTGKIEWETSLREKHDLKLPQWGFSASPLVLDEMIVQAMGYVFAFDRKGKVIWQTEKDYKESYANPSPAKIEGRDVLVCFNGQGVVVLDRKSGKELATHPWKTNYNVNAATPVVVGNKIFISSGYNKGCAMFEMKDGALEMLWESRVMRNHMSGCVEKGGYLYGFDESTFKCLNMDGEVQWSQRGLGKGAFVMAGDRLVILSSRGDLVIAQVDPEEFKELSRRNVLSGGVYWTTPVVCGGKIYARNSLGDLICLDHRKKAD